MAAPGVIGVAAVADGNIEITIRSENDRSAVVIEYGLSICRRIRSVPGPPVSVLFETFNSEMCMLWCHSAGPYFRKGAL